MEERQTAYRALIKEQFNQSAVAAIRYANNKGWALGDNHSVHEIAAAVSRRVAPLPKGRPAKEGI